jgi:hypothetical protein
VTNAMLGRLEGAVPVPEKQVVRAPRAMCSGVVLAHTAPAAKGRLAGRADFSRKTQTPSEGYLPYKAHALLRAPPLTYIVS